MLFNQIQNSDQVTPNLFYQCLLWLSYRLESNPQRIFLGYKQDTLSDFPRKNYVGPYIYIKKLIKS